MNWDLKSIWYYFTEAIALAIIIFIMFIGFVFWCAFLAWREDDQ